MNTTNQTSKILGVAFLLQFVTSFASAMFLRATWFVPGNMSETVVKIANNASLLRLNILFDMLTALGVIFLGAMLFITVRKQKEKIALTALGFYILEGALLAVSRTETFLLLRLSQEYVSAGQPVILQTFGNMAFESMEFTGGKLHMLAFCLGGIMFYYLLDQSRVVPRALSLWGLIAVFPMLIGTLAQVFGYSIPFIFYAPYVPFELVFGIWILVKGIAVDSEVSRLRAAVPAGVSA